MLAMDALADGDTPSATSLCHESLQLVRGYLATPMVVPSLMCGARIAHASGHHDRVAYLHGVVGEDIPWLRSTMPPQSVALHDRVVEEAADALGPAAFGAEVARGKADGRRPAVEHALAWTAPSPPAERKHLPGRSNDGALSPRQTDVLVLMAAGLSNKEIAERLGIRRRTAEHHSEAIFRKLGVRGRTEATAWAHRNGLV
jgi:DNA-binding CsgD family transcriptional regulator